MDRNMLVVSAHAADWCTRAGGTIIKYVNAGWDVTVFAYTFGEHGESGAYWKGNPAGTVDECKKIRRREAGDAAAFIGIKKIEFFDFGDYPLAFPETEIRKLTGRILEIRPAVILTHWNEDPFNMDHEVTSKAVVRAAASAGMTGALPDTPAHYIPDIFFFETTIPMSEFNRFSIDTYVDIEDVFDEKIEAVKRFAVQPQLVDYYTRCALSRGAQAHDWARGRRTIKYAEAFKRYVPFVGDELPLTRL